tara:strand:+ start:80 stop:1123 length:1044 start_codon:yes stop_codon:yes gene_type:complete
VYDNSHADFLITVAENTYKRSRKLAQVWGFKKGKSSLVPRHPDISHLRLDAEKLKKIADDLYWDTKLLRPEIIVYHISDNEGKPMKMKKYWKGGKTQDASSVIYDVVCRPVATTSTGKIIVEISPPPQQGNPPPRLNAFYEAGIHYRMFDPVNCLIIKKTADLITDSKPQPLTIGRVCAVFNTNISSFEKGWVSPEGILARDWVKRSDEIAKKKKKKTTKKKKKAKVAPLPVAPVPPPVLDTDFAGTYEEIKMFKYWNERRKTRCFNLVLRRAMKEFHETVIQLIKDCEEDDDIDVDTYALLETTKESLKKKWGTKYGEIGELIVKYWTQVSDTIVAGGWAEFEDEE